jgi:hypothetical protein
VIGTLRFAARGWIAGIYIDPAYHFPYWGFAWVRPWPGVGMYLHFAALALAAPPSPSACAPASPPSSASSSSPTPS